MKAVAALLKERPEVLAELCFDLLQTADSQRRANERPAVQNKLLAVDCVKSRKCRLTTVAGSNALAD
jgi:hypothetical protein